jgi:hypothetical protein
VADEHFNKGPDQEQPKQEDQGLPGAEADRSERTPRFQRSTPPSGTQEARITVGAPAGADQAGTTTPATAPGKEGQTAPPPASIPAAPSTPPARTPADPAQGATKPSSAADAPIMSKLPHTRPQRRSARRPATGRGSRAGASGTAAKAAGGRASSRAQGAGARASSSRSPRKGGANAAQGRASERPTGVQARAIDAVRTTAMLPVKLTGSLARTAADLIGRGIRRR